MDYSGSARCQECGGPSLPYIDGRPIRYCSEECAAANDATPGDYPPTRFWNEGRQMTMGDS